MPTSLARDSRDPEFLSFSGFHVAEVGQSGCGLAGLLDVEVRNVRGTVEETDNLAGIGDRPSRDNPAGHRPWAVTSSMGTYKR